MMKFGCRVQDGDVNADGVSINADSLDTGSGATIRGGAENDADLTHDAVDDDGGHKVDSPDETAPTVESLNFVSIPGADEAYVAGDNILVVVTLSEDVTVTGDPQLEIDVGGRAKTASFEELDEAEGVWVGFRYTAAVGDTDTDGIAIAADKLSLNGGTIQDGAGNDAVLTHAAVAADSGHKVSVPGGL